MTRSDMNRDAPRRALSSLGLAAGVAVLLVATACGPLRDDDEEEPTATPARAASPAASAATPVARPEGATPGLRGSPPAGTPAALDDGTPSAPTAGTPTPAEGDVDEETPGTPEAADRTPTPPVVEGCQEPEELPEVQGPRDRAVAADADEGVNLRAGPGEGCDILVTLPAGTPLEVESGPVRAGEFAWVKVTVDGTEGWIAEEFLEPLGEDEGA